MSKLLILGLGLNIVDDTATPFGDTFLDIKDTWNAVPYPSRISIGRFFKNGLGIEVIGTYNKYKVGNNDGAINTAPRDYFAIDGKISYDLNKLIGKTNWFDPYLHVGSGYSSIGNVGRFKQMRVLALILGSAISGEQISTPWENGVLKKVQPSNYSIPRELSIDLMWKKDFLKKERKN